MFRRNSVIVFLLSLISSYLPGLTVPDSVEPYFLYRNADGSVNVQENLLPDEIIRLSFIFGLCREDSDEWKSAWNTYKNLRQKCVDLGIPDLDEMQKGDGILLAMYENLLYRYDFNQTRTHTMLNEGIYNCVSSSLLYLALAKEFGLDARVQETPRHSFIIVHTKDGGEITVETTNPYGFNPGQKRIVSQSSHETRYAVIPAKNYANRQEISERRAIALVSNNLNGEFNRLQDFASAVPLASANCFFVQKEREKARREFEAICSNFAVFADRSKKSDEALDFLEKIFERYGNTKTVGETYDGIVHNMAASSLNRKDYKGADEILQRRKNHLSQKEISLLERMIDETRFVTLAQDFAKKNEHLQAAKICGEGLCLVPDSANLKNLRRVSLENHGIEIHNRITPLVNSRQYGAALEILHNALAENPDNRTLKNDLVQLNRITGRNP